MRSSVIRNVLDFLLPTSDRNGFAQLATHIVVNTTSLSWRSPKMQNTSESVPTSDTFQNVAFVLYSVVVILRRADVGWRRAGEVAV
jgi:hypothetical protein